MKIRMLDTYKLLGTWPMWTFHKGRTYSAVPATNQPERERNGLVFATKRNGQSILLCKEEYEIV